MPLEFSAVLGGSADGPIVNQRSGQCLTTDGIAGHQLFQYPCQTRADGSPVAGQQWRVENVDADGVLWHSTLIKSLDYGLVADVSGYSYAPGAAVVTWRQGSAGYYYKYALNQIFNQARVESVRGRFLGDEPQFYLESRPSGGQDAHRAHQRPRNRQDGRGAEQQRCRGGRPAAFDAVRGGGDQ